MIRPIPPLTGMDRWGIIERRFSGADSTIIASDRVRCFGMLNPRLSVAFGGAPPYRIRTVLAGNNGAVDEVESEMALSHPVLVNTCIDSASGEALHWVVADGMTTRWDTTGTGQHRGTYRIHDPLGVSNKLLSAPFHNAFTKAELTEPSSPLTEGEGGSLVFSLCGTAILGIIDPAGHQLIWEEQAGGYRTDINDCLIFPGFTITRPSAAAPEIVMDVAIVARVLAGGYVIQLTSTGTEGFAIQVGAHDAAGGYRSVAVSASAAPGESLYYLLSNSADPESLLGIQEMDPARVRPVPLLGERIQWSVRPNPAMGKAEIVFTVRVPDHVGIAVFNVAGRRITTLVDGFMSAGEHRVYWDGLTEQGVRAGAGVYWLQLMSPSTQATKRLVYVR